MGGDRTMAGVGVSGFRDLVVDGWRCLRRRRMGMLTDIMGLLANRGRVLGLEDFPDRGVTLPTGPLRFEGCVIVPGTPGVHDADGQPILASFLRRGFGVDTEYPSGAPVPVQGLASDGGGFLERVVFVPRIDFGHFGHLLTETVGWVGGLLDPASVLSAWLTAGAVVVVGEATETDLEALGRLLGLSRDRVILARRLEGVLRCGVVLVPQPTCINRCAIHDDHFVAVRRFLERQHGLEGGSRVGSVGGTAGQQKTYLSRSRLPAGSRRILAEEALEEELAVLGWRVVHPEMLPIAEQLAVLEGSAVVAGHIGSALHLMMYLGSGLAGRQVLGLGMANGQMNPNYSNQFRAQGIGFRHLCCLRHIRYNSAELRLTLPVREVARWLEVEATGGDARVGQD